MKVFILTLGTRGDFELFLALGRALFRRGHHVVLGTSPFYAERTRAAGIEWVQMGTGTQEEIISVLKSLSSVRDRTRRTYLYYTRWLRPQLSMALHRITSLGAETDYFISNLKMMLQRQDGVIPGAVVTYDPPLSLEELARYGVQEHKGIILDLVAFSKKLLDPQGQWGEQYLFTGFWRHSLQADWKPDEELVKFLNQGAPPVVITMGSMVMFDGEKLAADIARALKQCGQRGIVVGGWSGLSSMGASSDTIFYAAEVAYDWLLPKASCVIHHGGTGTSAAVLGAGKPSILFPQIISQELFGRILLRENLATGLFDAHMLNCEELAAAIDRAVADKEILNSVRNWQKIIHEDKGVEAAADSIEAHWNRVRRK